MTRNKDLTPHKCRLCGETIPASGMGSHLYHKHDKISSEEYVKRFGEFRKKYLKEASLIRDEFQCKECSKACKTHKQLMQHVNKEHGGYEKYIVKHHYGGVWPLCKCGCGERVTLLQSGKNNKGEPTYAREYIIGHDTKLRQPGYRSNTPEQKARMRRSAIKRMQEQNSIFHQAGPSRGEQDIADFIRSLDLDIIQSDKKLLNGLEVDILIPDLKIAIEYNGTYFHSDLFKERNYHLNKTKELSGKGYRLIHIWEPDWYNKPDIVKSILRHICNKTSDTIYARKTSVKQLERTQANHFLRENHLQGGAIGTIYLGLFHGEELVGVMSFSKLRKATGLSHKEGSYELLRFATKLNTKVVGGASKLFSFFIKQYTPSYILSYANRDWSIGNLYKSLQMYYVGTTPPGYYYIKSRIKYSRFQFQKHKLVAEGEDTSKTEYEIMTERGYHRIWDCGNIKYEWKV